MADPFRTEHDALGEFPVPREAYYGIHTARAATNFTISRLRLQPAFVRMLGHLKRAAALANRDLGRLEPGLANAIAAAADEVAQGRWDAQFIVDVFQSGSGTSTNMNANEVIANRANETVAGAARGHYRPIHPNDQVNLSQSSNDVIPTVVHATTIARVHEVLQPALERLEASLAAKARALDGVVKTGRTHLVDAVPIRMGQEFRGYAGQVERARRRVGAATDGLREVALGGTAVGTGLNGHPEFASRTLRYLAEQTGIALVETENHFQAQSAMDGLVAFSGSLRGAATALVKVANDLRLMASGPRAGLGEITLPELQPGSSIMPGKVNPVIPEAVVQACARVIGCDTTIALSGQWGFFELNTMWPVAAYHALDAIDLLAAAAIALAEKCVDGIEATPVGPRVVERSGSLATPLAVLLGYDAVARMVHRAAEEDRPLREVLLAESGLDEAAIDRALDVRAMTGS